MKKKLSLKKNGENAATGVNNKAFLFNKETVVQIILRFFIGISTANTIHLF